MSFRRLLSSGPSPGLPPLHPPAAPARVIAGLLALTVAGLLALATPAPAADVVSLRVEGRTATLFEGSIRTPPGDVQAAGDPTRRRCDGTNHGAHPTPGATPTKAAADAMRLIGTDFGAQWYPGFDDYFVQRFGPDGESPDGYEYWGVLAENVFTAVGGCQAQVAGGQRVLWAYDAFNQRGFLELRAADDRGAAPRASTTVAAGEPLSVAVTRFFGAAGESAGPAADVRVAPVTTAGDGVQTVQPDGGQTTAADGTTSLTFATPGWTRVKATGGAAGSIRSNRLDVCVTTAARPDCGPAPADTGVREAPPLPPLPSDDGGGGAAPPPPPSPPPAPAPPVGAPVIQFPAFDRSAARRGRVGVAWKILQPGVGVRSWAFGARLAGRRGGAFRTVARGERRTRTALALRAGRAWDVRATFTDVLGRTVDGLVGTVLVPIDEAAKAVRLRGGWRRQADAGAWRGAVRRGRRGASATVRLAAGRPVVVVRSARRRGVVEVRAGRRTERYRIAATRRARTREVVVSKRLRRARAGTVRVRVVGGTVDLDGLGVRP